jgi:FkbM family methyltransferase
MMSTRRNYRKLLDGIYRYGLLRTLAGGPRLVSYALRGPRDGAVTTRTSNIILNFAYPSQFMPTLVLFRELVEAEYDYLPRVLTRSSVFFDVGGGIGAYTVMAAKYVDGPVHTFEPASEGVRAIRRNLRANGLEEQRVILNEVAVSGREGHGELFAGKTQFVGHIGAGAGAFTKVCLTTLDAYCSAHGVDRIDVLKVDVEGHEPEVIKGAAGLINRGAIDVIILEVNLGHCGLYRELERHSYRVFYYDVQRVRLVPLPLVTEQTLVCERPSSFNDNLVLIRDGAADHYRLTS